MVGEDEVFTTGMEVNGGAEVNEGHRATFDVPSGAPFSPGTAPVVLSIFGLTSFPEGEVGHIFALVFIGVGGKFGVGEDLALVKAGKATISGEGGDAKVNGAVGGDVGVLFFEQGADEFDLVRDVVNGSAFDGGGEEIKRGGVLVKEF